MAINFKESPEEDSKHARHSHHSFQSHQPPQTRLEVLAQSIDNLTACIDSFMGYAQNSMPNKVVYLIFILVFALIFGIEGLQFIFKTYLPKLLLAG